MTQAQPRSLAARAGSVETRLVERGGGTGESSSFHSQDAAGKWHFPTILHIGGDRKGVNYGAGSPECKGKDRMRERMAAAASGGNLLS